MQFENEVLRKIFGPSKEAATGGWRKYIFMSFPSIVRFNKSRRKTWVGRVTRMVELRNGYNILMEIFERRDHLRDKDVDGKIIVKWFV
jgi:hypothetical protein